MTTTPASLADVAQAIRTLNVVSTILGSLPSEPGMNGSVLLIDDKEAARCRREIEEAADHVERYAAQAAQAEPVAVNNAEVICPSCAHQFRAIPVDVQRLMLAAGFEPPFTAPPAAAQADEGKTIKILQDKLRANSLEIATLRRLYSQAAAAQAKRAGCVDAATYRSAIAADFRNCWSVNDTILASDVLEWLMSPPAAAAQAERAAPVSERESFEAWIKSDSTLPVDRDAHGYYSDMTTALMWHAWQASLKTGPRGSAATTKGDSHDDESDSGRTRRLAGEGNERSVGQQRRAEQRVSLDGAAEHEAGLLRPFTLGTAHQGDAQQLTGLPPLPDAGHYSNGPFGQSVVPWFSAEQMEAFARAAQAAHTPTEQAIIDAACTGMGILRMERIDPAAAQAAQAEPVAANNAEVICPSCAHQFRAIPVDVQRLMLAAGFEPPFTAPPAAAQAEQPVAQAVQARVLTDAVECLRAYCNHQTEYSDHTPKSFNSGLLKLCLRARAILAAADAAPPAAAQAERAAPVPGSVLTASERDKLRAAIMEEMEPLERLHHQWYGWPGTFQFAEAAIRLIYRRAALAAAPAQTGAEG